MAEPEPIHRCANCCQPLKCTFEFDQFEWSTTFEDYLRFLDELGPWVDGNEESEKPNDQSFCSHDCAYKFRAVEQRFFDDEFDDAEDDEEEVGGCEECDRHLYKFCSYHGSQFWYYQAGDGPSYYLFPSYRTGEST